MEFIRNAEAVTAIFGEWPSFHDAEIVSVYLTREGESAPILETIIHVFKATAEVNPEGRYILKNHTLVTFRFSGVREDVAIKWFNHQNVISSLHFAANPTELGTITVEMPSLYGADISFTCSEVAVVSAQPCTPEGTSLIAS